MATERVERAGDVIRQHSVGFAAMFGGAEFGERFRPLLERGEFKTEQFVCVRIICEREGGAIFAGSACMLIVEAGVAGAGEMCVEAAIVVNEVQSGERCHNTSVNKRRRVARPE